MLAPKSLLSGLLLAVLLASAAWGKTDSNRNTDTVLMRTLQQELDRAMSSLSKADPAPYYISYSASEESRAVIVGSSGAIVANVNGHERSVDISVRVGSRDLDNTHGDNRYHAI